MAGTLMPIFRPQFLDANGAPLASGTVETYAAGTSTPLATYADAALSTTNGTTITLNTGGYPQVSGSEVGIFLLPRAYKLVLKNSAGVTQRTLDNVYALQAASSVNLEIDGIAGVALSAGQFAYLSDGSGALTAGRWYPADADFLYASVTAVIAFVPTAIAQGATGTFRTGGIADGLAGLVAGSTYYISATAGAITATAPTNARAVGVASSATVVALDPHWSTGVLQRLLRINAGTPYSLTLPSADAAGFLQSDGAGTLSFASVTSPLNVCEGRLTATTATPVTTADVSAAATIYYTPYKGNRVALYSGSAWNVRTFTEISISLAALTASKPYDVFIVDAGAGIQPTIETLVWTNTTTRATALTKQDGVYVKTGATTRRYLGTVFINATGGQTDDSFAKRYIWNYYHRLPRLMRVTESTASWAYATATYRQANAAVANQLDFMLGVAEEAVSSQVICQMDNSAGATSVFVAIGLDSTTTVATGMVYGYYRSPTASTQDQVLNALTIYPAEGRHTLVWLEKGAASTTFTSTNSGTLSGIYGVLNG